MTISSYSLCAVEWFIPVYDWSNVFTNHTDDEMTRSVVVASYIALLIGVIVQHSPDYIDQIKIYLTDHSFAEIIAVLQQFLDFMKMADAASGNTGSKSIATVIGYLKECT